MAPPSTVKQIPLTDWPDTGLLKLIGEEKASIELYQSFPRREPSDANTPSNSWLQVCIPFGRNKNLRENFCRFWSNSIRIGRLLEILDYIGGSISYSYCYQQPYGRSMTLVTACVDHFNFFESITLEKDIYLTGYVTYVGTSSLELRFDMSHEANGQDVGTVNFLFVARSIEDHSKSVKVPRLIFDGEDDAEKCLLRFEFGKRNQIERKSFSANSVYKVPPGAEESVLLHNLFKLTFGKNSMHGYRFINQTKMEKTLIMHLQNRNVHGKIFGGFLMREAFELAWACVYLYAKGEYPEIIHIDEVTFLIPVDVGSLITFTAQVTYVEETLIHVLVTCEKMMIQTGEAQKTTEVHLTFITKSQLQPVLPDSYESGMKYLEAKRRVMNIVK